MPGCANVFNVYASIVCIVYNIKVSSLMGNLSVWFS